MSTCKECEHYEFYDGANSDNSGTTAIMFCKEETRRSHWSHIRRCITGFTPKKPVEKKTCGTCGNAEETEGSNSDYSIRCSVNKRLWPKTGMARNLAENCYRPIETPQEKAYRVEREHYDSQVKKPEEKKSCKDCDHCRLYDGPEKRTASGNKAVLFCHKDNAYYSLISYYCSRFTPKKPGEKSCDNCGRTSMNGGNGCDVLSSCKSFSHWRPIKPEEPEKPANPNRPCEDCAQRRNDTCKSKGYFCDDDNKGWRPIKPDKPKADCDISTCSHKDDDGKCSFQRTDGSLCTYHRNYKPKTEVPKAYYSMGGFMGSYSLTETPETKKENKMLAKFTIRRYVMACTAIVTVKLAILLNPVAIWYGSKVFSCLNSEREIDPVMRADIARCWIFTVVSITAICVALYAFNKLTAWIFGEKK